MIVHFFAPIDKIRPYGEIKYDFRKLGSEENLIKSNERMYCIKQCYKMCYFVSRLYHIEILKMQCEFVKDYNGTIWFNNATNIFVRPNM